MINLKDTKTQKKIARYFIFLILGIGSFFLWTNNPVDPKNLTLIDFIVFTLKVIEILIIIGFFIYFIITFIFWAFSNDND